MTWQLTRKDNGASIRFLQDLRWIDEFDWSAVAQSSPQRTLSGGLVIQQGIKQNGRFITLGGKWYWHSRADLQTLRGWSDIPSLQMTLTHPDGRTFNVMFATHDAALQSITPVVFQAPEDNLSPYTGTIHLMTI